MPSRPVPTIDSSSSSGLQSAEHRDQITIQVRKDASQTAPNIAPETQEEFVRPNTADIVPHAKRSWLGYELSGSVHARLERYLHFLRSEKDNLKNALNWINMAEPSSELGHVGTLQEMQDKSIQLQGQIEG